MPSPPVRPALRARYDAKQQRVVRDAAAIFARRGYDQTTVQQLADELGIAAGGLYHYFPGKEQILGAICEQIMDPFLEEAEALAAGELAPTEQLRAIVALWVRNVIDRRDHMLVFQQERHFIESSDEWRDVRARRKRFERLIDGTLQRVQESGDAAFDDRRLALSALLGMVNHTAQWYGPNGRLKPAEIADGYADLLLR
jgi:TetR/AcrR family transcriptional regulator, cholesterol catabolism regulator